MDVIKIPLHQSYKKALRNIGGNVEYVEHGPIICSREDQYDTNPTLDALDLRKCHE